MISPITTHQNRADDESSHKKSKSFDKLPEFILKPHHQWLGYSPTLMMLQGLMQEISPSTSDSNDNDPSGDNYSLDNFHRLYKFRMSRFGMNFILQVIKGSLHTVM